MVGVALGRSGPAHRRPGSPALLPADRVRGGAGAGRAGARLSTPEPPRLRPEPETGRIMTRRARGSTANQGPTVWARTGVALASRALPVGPIRERWREEFWGDLQVLGRRQQASYTVGVLANAWALRSALRQGEPAIMEDTVTRRPPLMCRLNLRHKWRVVSTEDGNPHLECIACRKPWKSFRPPGDWSPGF